MRSVFEYVRLHVVTSTHFQAVGELRSLPIKSLVSLGSVAKASDKVAPDLWYATSMKPGADIDVQ